MRLFEKPDPRLDTSIRILTHADLEQMPRIELFTKFTHRRRQASAAITKS